MTGKVGRAGVGKSDWPHAGDNDKSLAWFWIQCSGAFNVDYFGFGYPRISAKIVHVITKHSVSIRFEKRTVRPRVMGHGREWSLVLTYPAGAFADLHQMVSTESPLVVRVGVKPAAAERLLRATTKVMIEGEQAYVGLNIRA